MQISNNLSVLTRSSAGNARDQRLTKESDSREVARASSGVAETTETARNRLVEQTIQGEVLSREQALTGNPNPFDGVTPRTFNVKSQRDVSQSAVDAYQGVADQARRDNLINTLGIDVFA